MSWGGRVVINREIKAQVELLEWRAREKWTGREPIAKARVAAKFFVRDGRGDLDGKYTTLQDVLVNAGVLRNDSIARLKGFSCEAEIDPNERVEVEITEL
jgi:Holliday junction resolvase RusA-like endonuclease